MTLLSLPSIREEAWRWSDLSALPTLADQPATGHVPDRLPWLDCAGPRLLFVDGRLHESSDPQGVEFGELGLDPVDHPLARLVGRSGWRLVLDRDHAPEGPVQIVHLSTGSADHLAAEIMLDVDAQASIVESYLGTGWSNRRTRIGLRKGARLMVNRRLVGESGFASLFDEASVGEGASFTATTLAAGAVDSRIDGAIRLTGEEAYAEAGGALLARGKQRHDVNMLVRHEMPHGMSRQLWRSVADDKATCSVAARVEVARDAQKTDGEQSLKGLLLARAATVNAKPELEIFADDVKCAHGATVGALDPAALFYLASRGVPQAEAKALLTRAFVADAIDRIGEEEVREAFRADAVAWLGGVE